MSRAGCFRLTLFITLLLFTTALMATTVSAPKYSGKTTVQAGEHWSQRLEVERLDFIITQSYVEVHIRSSVLSGPNVDFFLFTEENYTLYVSGENATSIPDINDLNENRTRGGSYLKPGIYYFVVDNSDFGEADPAGESVTFEYDISFLDPESHRSNMLLLIMIPIVGLTMIIVPSIWLILRHRSERRVSPKPPK